jgi:hypothetical protein
MRFKKTAILISVILLVGLGSSAVVVNSDNWHDNALGISYSHFQDEEVHMVTNLGEGKLIADMLEDEEAHTVFESDSPVWNDYMNYLETNSIEAEGREMAWKEDQYDLYSEVEGEVDGFVVVKPGYGIDTIAAFPKVVISDYWLLYYNGEETVEFLGQQDKPVTFYGRYLDQPWEKLEGNQTVVSTGDKYSNNRRLAGKLLTGNRSSVMVVSESYFEKGFLKKGNPILVGQNLAATVDLLERNNVSIMEVVGAENVNFGNTIKDRMGEELTVIAKFGRRFTGVEGLDGTYPIKKFPVKPVERNIDLKEIRLESENRSEARVQLVFSNTGNIDTLMDFSAVQLGEGPDAELVSRPKQVKIRSGTELALTFPVNVSSDVSTAEVSYDYKGKSGLITQEYDVNATRINDSGKVSLEQIYYSEPQEAIILEVLNEREEPAWIGGQVDNLRILNRTETVLTEEVRRVASGETGTLSVDAYLDEDQREENNLLNVTLTSGEDSKKSFPGVSSVQNVRMEVRETGITGAFLESTTPIVALLILVLLAFYRYGLPEKLASRLEGVKESFR